MAVTLYRQVSKSKARRYQKVNLQAVKGTDALWHSGRDNRSEVGTRDPLIFAVLGEPLVVPGARTFALPENRAALQTVGTDDFVHYVAAVAPPADASPNHHCSGRL